MLSKILSKNDCANCRFCCSFRRCSLWEVPIFTGENIEAMDEERKKPLVVDCVEERFCATYSLLNDYKSDDPQEEVPCPYLDSHTGCILDEACKPWDCKIWPLRVAKKPDGEVVIALTPTCPAINKLDLDLVKEYVSVNLKEELLAYANAHPYLIKEFEEGFHIEL